MPEASERKTLKSLVYTLVNICFIAVCKQCNKTDLCFSPTSGQLLRNTVLIRPGNETLSGLAVAPYVFAGWSTSGPIGGPDIFWAELLRSTVTTARADQPADALTVYPSPVGPDGLVHLATEPSQRGSLRLLDGQGRAVRAWPAGDCTAPLLCRCGACPPACTYSPLPRKAAPGLPYA